MSSEENSGAGPVSRRANGSKSGATSSDVARRAGVSQSAVSRAFTDGSSISPKKRDAIYKAARELGYRPNALARAMTSGRSRLIALLVAYLDNQFYPVIVEKLSRRLQEQGYQVLLMMTEPGNQDELVQKILTYQVEGIVLASATLSSDLAASCAETGVPVVLFNRYDPGSPTSSVTSDNVEGGGLLALYLMRKGYRNIAFIAGAEDSSTSRDREVGFVRMLAENNLTLSARAVGGYSFGEAAGAARRLIDNCPEPPQAIFVANDHMAFAVIDVLRTEYGLQVPEQIEVVGYDDVPQARWKAYDFVSVEQPTDAMVNATVDMLIRQIESGEITREAAVLPATLRGVKGKNEYQP